MTLLPRCLCGSEAATPTQKNDLAVLACSCGVLRQDVPLDLAGYRAFYETAYFDGVYYHTREQDLGVAEKRLASYDVMAGQRLLDIGCGGGEFVEVARQAGVDAWGQDLATQSDGPWVYVGDLEEIGFPTEDFDVVTMHDVLEHVPDPERTLREVTRVLRAGGTFYLDWPRFHHDSGRHHWKETEHLWLLTDDQVVDLLKRAGFSVRAVTHPVPSKSVFTAYWPGVPRKRIMVPAGIGDAYWVMAKLPGFLKARGIEHEPSVYVQDHGPRRTQPYLRCLPMIHAAGYHDCPIRSPIWREAYLRAGRTVYPDEFGLDYFIAYNGVMRYGAQLPDVDPEFGCEWRPRMFVPKEALAFRDELLAGGPYVFAYFTDAGMYAKSWLTRFDLDYVHRSLRIMGEQLDARIVLTGADWDRGATGSQVAKRDPRFVDLVGETTFEQMLGALLGASLVYGFPAGNTILGAVLGRPTLLLWSDYFVPAFWTGACPPDANYRALDVAGLTPDIALENARQMLGL